MSYPQPGIAGSVELTATMIALLSKWSISTKGNNAKTTTFGATGAWELVTATTRGWTATAEGWTDPSDASQAALIAEVNSVVAVVFNIDGSHNFSGNALLTQVDPAADASGMNTIKFTFTGTGALTYA